MDKKERNIKEDMYYNLKKIFTLTIFYFWTSTVYIQVSSGSTTSVLAKSKDIFCHYLIITNPKRMENKSRLTTLKQKFKRMEWQKINSKSKLLDKKIELSKIGDFCQNSLIQLSIKENSLKRRWLHQLILPRLSLRGDRMSIWPMKLPKSLISLLLTLFMDAQDFRTPGSMQEIQQL